MAVAKLIRRGDSQGQKPLLSRRVSTMLVCLLLSCTAWLLQALSKEYTTVLRVPVTYMNLPVDRFIAGGLPDSVDTELSGSGFTLLTWQMGRTPGILQLDMRQARRNVRGDFTLLTNSNNRRLTSNFGRGARVVRVSPDTIAFSYAPRITRRVPIRPMVTVSLASQFQLADSVRTDPAFVEISGPAEVVNRIAFIPTEARVFSGLDKDITESIALLLTGQARQLIVKPTTVNVSIKVGQFTEGRFLLPVIPINVPPGVNLKTIPDKVTVVFQVPLSEYHRIRPDQFRVVADYKTITSGLTTLRLNVVRRPLVVRSLHTEPERVGFLISR